MEYKIQYFRYKIISRYFWTRMRRKNEYGSKDKLVGFMNNIGRYYKNRNNEFLDPS